MDLGRFNHKPSTRMYEKNSLEPNQSNNPSEKDCITTNINSDESCNSTNQSTTNLFTTTHTIGGSTVNLKQNTEINDILVSDLISDNDMPKNHNYTYSSTSSDHSKQINYNLLSDKFCGDFFSSSKNQDNNMVSNLVFFIFVLINLFSNFSFLL